jgi:hypothetical protein
MIFVIFSVENKGHRGVRNAGQGSRGGCRVAHIPSVLVAWNQLKLTEIQLNRPPNKGWKNSLENHRIKKGVGRWIRTAIDDIGQAM